MALRVINLFVDKDSGRLVESFTSKLQAAPQKFTIGDSVPINVRVLTADPEATWQEVDLTDQSIRLGIGTPAAGPTAGTWTITYGGDETSDLDFDATAAEVQTALNALASITSAGGVTVTKSTLGAYRIAFNTAGARTDFSTDNSNLYPSISSFIAEAITGDGSTKEVAILKLETQPAAYIELTDALPVAAATVATVREGASGVSEIQTLAFDSVPYAGTFAITIGSEKTGAIEWNASLATIKAAIEALPAIGTDKVTVTGTFPRYTVEFDASLTNVAAMTVDVTGLTVPTGRTGALNTNTTGIIELLDGNRSASAVLEIEIYDTVENTAFTAAQATCTVYDDVIGNTPTSQTPLPTYMTSGGVGTLSELRLENDIESGFYAKLRHTDTFLSWLTYTDGDVFRGGFSVETHPSGGFSATLRGDTITASRVYILPDNNGTFVIHSTGTAAPSTTPAAVGLLFINTTAKTAYLSVGTGSSADWKQITLT